jgi:hypothetical protein
MAETVKGSGEGGVMMRSLLTEQTGMSNCHSSAICET